MKHRKVLSIIVALVCIVITSAVQAQTSTFTYQGQLTDDGSPANGLYDLSFELFDDDAAGSSYGVLINIDTAVSNGLFTVQLDFGYGVFDGTDLWLEIGAVTNGGGAFTLLVPRQPITATPYALQAANAASATVAASAGSVAAANISGTILLTQLPTAVVTKGASIGIGTTTPIAPLDIVSDGSRFTINPDRLFGASSPGNVTLDIWGNQTLAVWDNLAVWGTLRVGGNSTIGAGSSAASISGGNFNDIGTNSFYSTIGGGQNNNIADDAYSATIAGGYVNDIGVSSAYSTIGGGVDNNIADNSYFATIAGGYVNDIGANSGQSAIGGGRNNNIADNSYNATIAGGYWNDIGVNSAYSTIGGGFDNNIASNAYSAVIPGGAYNDVGAGASYAFAAGRRAQANHLGAFVWADSQDADFASTVNNQFNVRAGGGVRLVTSGGGMTLDGRPVLVGGYQNTIADNSGTATIAGGDYNDIGTNSLYSAIGGGQDNNIGTNSPYSTLGGGFLNNIGTNSPYSTLGGGFLNKIADNSADATIAGGFANDIGVNARRSAIGGGVGNNIADNSYSATIAGGDNNDIGTNSYWSFIGGGYDNDIGANASRSTIGGGYDNNIASNAYSATIAGGYGNDIGTNSLYSAIGGGQNNNIANNSYSATIAGGYWNDIGVNSTYSTIGGGVDNNIASNAYSAVIPGGAYNDVGAGASYAFAAGRQAQANHLGAFVWADSQDADFASISANQFNVRAGGGVRLVTSGAGLTVDGVPVLAGPVSSSTITDNTIVNADINAAAAIADTKLATISTAGKVADTALSANVSKLGSSIESGEITDGTIVNADINAAAAIADTKLATISTAGKVSDSALSANVALLNRPNQAFAGDISSGGKSVVVGEETSLRIVRGRITSTGTLVGGSGFTPSRTGAGLYTITFSPPFSQPPSVTINPTDIVNTVMSIASVSTTSCQIRSYVPTVGYSDTGFHFIAIGPR